MLLDVVTNDPVWADWSVKALAAAQATGPLFINAIIYAEIAAPFSDSQALDSFVSGSGLDLLPIPREAFFAASKAHISYRRAGGVKTGVLPDFFIGAHAAALEIPVLTRDSGRYRTYFPTIALITPKMN